jgi:hypothetical protein
VTVPVDYLLSRGQQIKVFSVILHKARELGFLCPDDKKIGTDAKYEGATVLEAKKGAYFDVVSGLDFASREYFAKYLCAPHMRASKLFMGPLAGGFIGKLLLYNLVVWLVFLPFYFLIDYEKHFQYTNKDGAKQPTWRGKLYFSLMTHSAAMAGDIVPITDLARTLLSLHILATWIQLMFIFVAPDASTVSSQVGKLVRTVAGQAKVIVANSRDIAKVIR